MKDLIIDESEAAYSRMQASDLARARDKARRRPTELTPYERDLIVGADAHAPVPAAETGAEPMPDEAARAHLLTLRTPEEKTAFIIVQGIKTAMRPHVEAIALLHQRVFELEQQIVSLEGALAARPAEAR